MESQSTLCLTIKTKSRSTETSRVQFHCFCSSCFYPLYSTCISDVVIGAGSFLAHAVLNLPLLGGRCWASDLPASISWVLDCRHVAWGPLCSAGAQTQDLLHARWELYLSAPYLPLPLVEFLNTRVLTSIYFYTRNWEGKCHKTRPISIPLCVRMRTNVYIKAVAWNHDLTQFVKHRQLLNTRTKMLYFRHVSSRLAYLIKVASMPPPLAFLISKTMQAWWFVGMCSCVSGDQWSPLDVVLQVPVLLFWDRQGLSLAWSLPSRLGWPVSPGGHLALPSQCPHYKYAPIYAWL